MNKEYFVVTGSTVPFLEEEVNKKLEQGWEPQGGISLVVTHPEADNIREGFFLVQAMIREKT